MAEQFPDAAVFCRGADDDPGVSLVRTGARQPGGVPGPGAGAKEGSRA